MTRLINYIKEQQGRWILRLFLVYLGNPAIFLLFVAFVLPAFKSAFGESWLTSKTMSTNVGWINPIWYIAMTLPVYIGWLALITLPQRIIDMDKLLDDYVSDVALGVSVPGLLNLLIWFTTGMEGNIMGFLVALPLLVTTVVNCILWVCAIRNATSSSTVQPESAPKVIPQATIIWRDAV